MVEPPWPEQVELSAYLTDLDNVQRKLRIPPPIVVLLSDLLNGLPRRIGSVTSGDLVSALLVRAQQAPSELPELIGDYRETQAHTVLDTDEEQGSFPLPTREDLRS